MLLATPMEAAWQDLKVCHEILPEKTQKDRILAALGSLGDLSPHVGAETILRYYRYLAANLAFPFTAYYPLPKTSQEEVQYRASVVELLDPRKHVGGEFDGLLCKVRKGQCELHLPLTELNVLEGDPNSQLIEDYLCWFWRWR